MKIILIVSALVIAATARPHVKASDACGQANDPLPPQKIIGGTAVKPNSWPWQVAMCRGPESTGLVCRLICGGTIISNQYVLTAAHCVVSFDKNEIRYKYGAHLLSDDNPDKGQGVAGVEEFYPHPDYNSQTIQNDIAVVKLNKEIPMTPSSRPVCLAGVDGHLQEGQLLIDIGWGVSNVDNFPTPTATDELMQVAIDYKAPLTCVLMTFHFGFMHESVLCAGGNGEHALCFGDSGGPMILKDESSGQYFQYGINSFVTTGQCVEEGRPMGLARVATLCSYVESVVGEGICLTPPSVKNMIPKEVQKNPAKIRFA
jgi:chymotrypsin